jgi:hypothetical protein
MESKKEMERTERSWRKDVEEKVRGMCDAIDKDSKDRE